MTDNVSYNLPSWNPFAAAAESNIYKSRSEIKEEPEDEEPIDETSNEFLVKGLEALDHVNPKTVDRDYLQDVLTCDKLNIILERFQKAADKRKITWRKQPGTIISAASTNTIDIIRADSTNTIDKHDNGKKKPSVQIQPHGKQPKATTSYRKSDKEKPDTLKKMEYINEEHKQAAQIAGKKIRKLIDILEIHHKDVTENGYFFTDEKDQKEYMLGLEALTKIMKPTIDNRYVVGGLEDYFDPIAEYLRKSQNWSEHPEFVRDHRYQMLPDGTFKDRYEYTKSHILGGSIIPIINDVIFITNNFPFLKAFYKNHFETKYQALQNREKDDKESVKKDGKK